MTDKRRPTRKRPCLLCDGVEDHPVHGSGGRRGPHKLIDGRPVVAVLGTMVFVHAYDPGERRQS